MFYRVGVGHDTVLEKLAKRVRPAAEPALEARDYNTTPL